jgi:hypothetical protein
MYLQKVISRKNFIKRISFFVGVLKVSDENSRFRIQIPIIFSKIYRKISKVLSLV